MNAPLKLLFPIFALPCVALQAVEPNEGPEAAGAPKITFSVPSTRADTVDEDKIQPKRFEGHVVKVFTAREGEAIFRAYAVVWKGAEVVVQDPHAETQFREGDPIDVFPMNLPYPQKSEPHRLLDFTVAFCTSHPGRGSATADAGGNDRIPSQKFEGKVLNVYMVKDDKALFRAYAVAWKGYEVIVEDPLVRTHYVEGDAIPVHVMNLPFPRNAEPYRLLKFVTGFAFSNRAVE